MSFSPEKAEARLEVGHCRSDYRSVKRSFFGHDTVFCVWSECAMLTLYVVLWSRSWLQQWSEKDVAIVFFSFFHFSEKWVTSQECSTWLRTYFDSFSNSRLLVKKLAKVLVNADFHNLKYKVIMSKQLSNCTKFYFYTWKNNKTQIWSTVRGN